MKDLDIQKLQRECHTLRNKARIDKSDTIWCSYRDKRNELKSNIRKTRRDFYNRALSSNKPKEVWKVIHRILHPNPQPLRFQPDELNAHFASTAQRVTGASAVSEESIKCLIDSLPVDRPEAFVLGPVTCGQVLLQLKKLRSDCSCGPDGIPVKFLKIVADHLAPLLTHILNNFISRGMFPSAWKVARISAIPKCATPKDNNDLRPISILPVLSKIYERLVLGQMEQFVSCGPTRVLKDTVCAYRKGHSTTTTLLAMKDDIVCAQKRGEVTMAVLADFSKAFDTVAFETVLKKLHVLGFSKSFLIWIVSYLTGRRQFVQVDDKASSLVDVTFGVPQGSVLGPVLFNLYVNDLSERLGDTVKCHQYADDTTFYTTDKPAHIKECQGRLQEALDHLSRWSSESNLALNPTKTKVMLLSTPQLARVHGLQDYQVNLTVDAKPLERVSSAKLLGTELHQSLRWNDDINAKISSCYATLSVLKKLKNIAPFNVRKQLAESLVLSKLDYNNIVIYPTHEYLVKRLQRVQLAAAGFVCKKFADLQDIIKLGWLPIKERQDYHLANAAYQAVTNNLWPEHLRLEQYVPPRLLRSSREFTLNSSHVPGTFKYHASRVFNTLPSTVRSSKDNHEFRRLSKAHYVSNAVNRLTEQ